jgi:hypothetical protein
MTGQQQPPRKWRVTVIEWLSHVAVIQAETAKQAEEQARELWAENAEHEVFHFEDSDVDCVIVDDA